MIDVNGRIIINLDVCTDDFTKARISNSPAVLTHPMCLYTVMFISAYIPQLQGFESPIVWND